MKGRGEMNQRIWNALRWHKGPITLKELLQIIGLEKRNGNMERYLKNLIQYGYVRRVGYGRYQLVRHTGPKAPHMKSFFFDPNLNKAMTEGKDA